MCLYPNFIQVTTSFETGEIFQKFVGRPVSRETVITSNCKVEYFPVPCQNCVECLSQHAEEWAFRVMRECSFHDHNCMLTLTYANNPISLCKRDYQLFLKSLRKALYPLKIRYFGCGEYGSKFSRPHFHVIIFGWMPDDLVYFFSRNGHSVYRSDFISKLWYRGFITVEEVTLKSAKYCAKYLQKLRDYPSSLLPPFTFMSLKPGIGYNDDYSYLDTDKLYIGGRYFRTPRYFLKKADERGDDLHVLRTRRLTRAGLLSLEDLDSRRIKARERFGILMSEKKFEKVSKNY